MRSGRESPRRSSSRSSYEDEHVLGDSGTGEDDHEDMDDAMTFLMECQVPQRAAHRPSLGILWGSLSRKGQDSYIKP